MKPLVVPQSLRGDVTKSYFHLMFSPVFNLHPVGFSCLRFFSLKSFVVFTAVCFVFQQDSANTAGAIFMKLGGRVEHGLVKKMLGRI